MEQEILKLQSILDMKPILLIGTGLSISMGLPGMKDLTDHLATGIPRCCDGKEHLLAEWRKCKELIEENGLEDGLGKTNVSEELLNHIVEQTACLIEKRDKKFKTNFFSNQNYIQDNSASFPLTKLLKYLVDSLSPSNKVLEVITPNYDHLIEYACDCIGVTCSTGFKGNYIQAYSNENLRSTLYINSSKGITPTYKHAEQVRLYKPHGSLYWQNINGRVVECSEILSGSQRVIITPGLTKYTVSMTDTVMNTHRELANECIRKASSIVIIGYGFNDSHLQTELFAKLSQGLQCLILTKELGGRIKKLVNECPNIIALEAAEEEGQTLYYNKKEVKQLPVDLWSLDGFIKQVI